jgi:hypothetical protein
MQSQPHLESYTARPTGRATEISVWHVAVSSDDVKVMTLEQLDDAFRLDVIDTSTPVWKAGMSTWSPLGVVAGIDDEPTTAHVSVRQEPAALWPPPAWPPQHTAPAHLNAVSNREAAPRHSRSPAPPALRPTVAPSGPNVRSAVPAASPRPAAPVSRPAPPSARPTPPSARPTAAPMVANFSMPASVPPAAYSVPPQSYARQKGSSSFGSWVLGLAVVAGLAVTAHRNDLLLRVARAAHVEAHYLRIEKAFLGGPSFGTLRSVAALKIRETLAGISGTSQGVVVGAPPVAQQPAVAAAVAPSLLSVQKPAETRPEPKTPTGAVDLKSLPVEGDGPAAAPAAPTQPAPVAKAAPAKAQPAPAKPAPAKQAAPVAASKKEPAEKSASAESEPSDALKAAMTGKAAKASSDAPPAKPAAAKTGSELPRTATGELDLKAAIGDAVRRHPPKKKDKGPGAEYDPLNGDL